MSNLVELERDGGIAVIAISNPPVNALGHGVRAGLIERLQEASDAPEIQAVVVIGAGRGFSGGADITEFGQPSEPPSLPEVIAAFERSAKPTIAAIHGIALGGGLELALGCHYRVATPDARLGLPEVKLGLLPGAGGTQRLPRLIGPEAALKLIASGDPLAAAKAHEQGLIDGLIDGELKAGAVDFARQIVADGAATPRTSERDDMLVETRRDPSRFEALAAETVKRARGLQAPKGCVECVRNAFTLPFGEGATRERELFETLREGDQSKAQRHIFFAERAASKVADLSPDVRPRKIERAAVIGAGTMGGGIAMNFANAGLPVTIVETSQDALDRGLAVIRRNYEGSVSRGRLAQEEADRRFALIEGTTDMGRAGDTDIVIEAVFEEMEVKKEVFGQLDAIAPAHAVLATNTSYLDVDEIARATSRPEAVVGMHFFSPANVMRLVEVVRAAATAPDVLATAIDLSRKLGKIPAVVGVCHGFVGNRMLRARSIELQPLLLEGALPKDVDDALVEFGFPMGPFAMSDLAGLDINWRMRKARGERAEIADRLCEEGRFGQKTGRGYFLYGEGSRKPNPDPEVEEMIREISRTKGIERRTISADEIVERTVYPMINEGARILAEGIAQWPGDIDVIWVYGYGWPVWRGGPMFYGDQLGLGQVRDRLSAMADSSGDERHRPAALLERLANEGKRFADI